MKIIDKQSTEIVEDRVCDVCNESLMVNINGEKFEEHGELKAAWVRLKATWKMLSPRPM